MARLNGRFSFRGLTATEELDRRREDEMRRRNAALRNTNLPPDTSIRQVEQRMAEVERRMWEPSIPLGTLRAGGNVGQSTPIGNRFFNYSGVTMADFDGDAVNIYQQANTLAGDFTLEGNNIKKHLNPASSVPVPLPEGRLEDLIEKANMPFLLSKITCTGEVFAKFVQDLVMMATDVPISVSDALILSGAIGLQMPTSRQNGKRMRIICVFIIVKTILDRPKGCLLKKDDIIELLQYAGTSVLPIDYEELVLSLK